MILEKWWGLSSGKLALSVARGQHGGVSSPEACGAQQVAHLPLTSHWDRMDWCLMMPFCRQDLCSQGLQGCFFDWGSSVNFTDCDAQVPILRYWTLPGLPKKRTLCLVPKETSPHKKEEGVPGPGIWTLKEMQKLRFSWQSFFFWSWYWTCNNATYNLLKDFLRSYFRSSIFSCNKWASRTRTGTNSTFRMPGYSPSWNLRNVPRKGTHFKKDEIHLPTIKFQRICFFLLGTNMSLPKTVPWRKSFEHSHSVDCWWKKFHRSPAPILGNTITQVDWFHLWWIQINETNLLA